MAKKYQTPRGVRDILPEENRYFDYVVDAFTNEAKKSGYGRIETPIFEDTDLFERGVGKSSDIVRKEMYTFQDKSKNSLTLRPEGTAPVVRAYLEKGMQSLPRPVGLYYYGPLFRYERPQAGRYRQYFTFGVEVIGDMNPLLDATMIATFWRVLKNLKLKNITLQINSIGCPSCRPKFKKDLDNFLSKNLKNMCKDCAERAKTNPLRVFDCKESKCQSILEEAPLLVNNLCKECYDHFKEVLEWLDELDISYEINPKLVRGMDYYTKTVFEVWTEEQKGQNTLVAGGRYDGLVELLGGRKTPAIGYGVGVDRVVEEMKRQKIEINEEREVEVFVAQIGEVAKKKGFRLLYDLQKDGVSARAGLDKGKISDQLKMANKLGVYFTLIIGQKEAMSDTVIIKDMESGNQEMYPIAKVVKEIKKRIRGLRDL